MCIRVGSRLNYHTVLALGNGRHVHEKVIENICQVDAFCAC